MTSGQKLAYAYQVGENWYVKINHDIYGPYGRISLLRLTGDNFGFRREDNGEYYLEIYLSE
jgi:hypothetical protein